MCGIAGLISPSSPDVFAIAREMANSIHHRGPDDSGVWQQGPLALASARLAVQDLSVHGKQPMISASGRYVIAYNGEVYNFGELSQELEKKGHKFSGHSDTEVLLAAFEEWGIETSLPRFNGMFAFALFDKRENVLHLVRDRLGIKPLYYGWSGDTFLFGSELKTIRCYPNFESIVDRSALSLLLAYGYIPAPQSIYRGIYKQVPGSILSLSLDQAVSLQQEAMPKTFWSIEKIASDSLANQYSGTADEANCELEELLSDAVRMRMISDVPVGAFLSGGIDSSCVVALMQKQSSVPVKTFTIGFAEDDYNEASHAKGVAAHLQTDHTELVVTARDALDVIPQLPSMYDEPFSDASQLPTYLVSQLAKKEVTVSLSGDGGDELFCGYNRYLQTQKIWPLISWMPSGLRSSLASLIPLSLLAGGGGDKQIEKIKKLKLLVSAKSLEEAYDSLLQSIKPQRLNVAKATVSIESFRKELPFMQRAMFYDQAVYLPDDLLAKLDRASMAVSLEARVPILDHRVVEFAASLPMEFKTKNGVGKLPLRAIANRHIPSEILDRPKMGFSVPIGTWLKGELRDWGESLLEEKLLERQGYHDVGAVRAAWQAHQSGEANYQQYLWAVLMFQAWLAEIS